jgi:3'(2'), 5'-bisphosphate nucleotidase
LVTYNFQAQLTGIVMDPAERNGLALRFANIASEAGRLIMAIRNSDFGAELKPDGSPVTAADVQAEQLIRRRLTATLPGVSVIAEESFETAPKGWSAARFLLVDPLDGTREFIRGSDEFTVNIALIENGEPIAGAIFAPALRDLYLAGDKAYWTEVEPGAILPGLPDVGVIGTSSVPGSGIRAIGSRSHMDQKTEKWMLDLPVAELRSAGSSLKFCLIARGEADVYPRMGSTMEWDTAAGHAILRAAGGCVLNLDGEPLQYGKADLGFTNHGFVAWGRSPSLKSTHG